MTTESEAAAVCRDIYPRLVGALGLFCGDRDAAEDLAQEALARLWRRWFTNDRPDHPLAWCYRVGVNLARSAARRRRIEARVLRRVHAATRQAAEPDLVPEVLAVRAALLDLPSRQRQVIVLRHYLGLSVREAAQAMECAPGTVTALTRQAVVNLHHAGLVASGDEPEEANYGRP